MFRSNKVSPASASDLGRQVSGQSQQASQLTEDERDLIKLLGGTQLALNAPASTGAAFKKSQASGFLGRFVSSAGMLSSKQGSQNSNNAQEISMFSRLGLGSIREAAADDVDPAMATSIMFKQSKSIAFRKKVVFVQVAVLAILVLSVFLLVDAISLLAYEQVSLLQVWTLPIMFVHVASIYVSLFAFIYANESGDSRRISISLSCGAVNTLLFFLRIAFQVGYADLMPGFYANSVKAIN